MDTVRPCAYCGDDLPTSAHWNRRFCSPACHRASTRPSPRLCVRGGCTGVFQPSHGQKYCSAQCRRIDEYTRTRAQIDRRRLCAACGAPFHSVYAAETCSDECRTTERTRRAAETAKAARLAARAALGTGTCATCGERLPDGHSTRQKYCSQTCSWRASSERVKAARAQRLTARPCAREDCGEMFTPRASAKRIYCSRRCKGIMAGRQYQVAHYDYKPRVPRVCAYEGCRKPIPADAWPTQRWCTPDGACCNKARRQGSQREHVLAADAAYRAANAEMIADVARRNSYKRRAAVAAKFENFPRLEIFIRDGWICQLCGTPVDKAAKPRAPLAPSLDHIVPLSRGGRHEVGNLAAACFPCNCSKNDRLLSEWSGRLAA